MTGWSWPIAARLAPWPRWARGALAFAAGALGALALPPYHVLPGLAVAFVALAWLIDGARGWRAAAVIGWLFGAGFFGLGLAWLGNAFMVDAERFGAFAIPAVAGLAAGLALFPALAAGMARLARPGWRRALALALAWTTMEWLRGHVLTGFPWNLLATVWDPFTAPVQLAALAGAYGLSLATALIAILPAAGARGLAGAVVLLALLWGGGAARIAVTETPADGPPVRVVQGNVAQHHKWRDDLRQAHLDRYVALSRGTDGPRPAIIVWPETAVPYFLDEEAGLRGALATLVAPDGVLITGVVRRAWNEHDALSLYNSVQAIGATGALAATYDKAHLVPFGEYTPLRAVLSWARLVPGAIDFSAGPGPVTWRLPGLPAPSPLVCYEAIFPGAVTAPGDRPDWLLNVTNDAWFGLSAGPHQHMAAARLRAVEEGLPLVRAANTGISAIVDALGRTVARLELGTEGVIDAPLPGHLAPPPYAQFGDLLLIPILVLWVVAGPFRRW